MNLFIDTNIFLSFYHLTSEDLIELQKLVVLIENKEITLYLPQQVIEETWRNRATKINDSFGPFTKVKFTLSYPAYCKNYPEYDAMRKSHKECEELHATMSKKILTDIEGRKLAADILLTKLFSIAKKIDRSEAILRNARERVEIGNPPGKKGSLGDAINWESLLSISSKYIHIALISDDSDLSSPLNPANLNEYLYEEWNTKKYFEPLYFRKLSDFFKKHYPNINLATEVEKDHLIEKLASSSNFATTHALIASLSKYSGFTIKQAEDLINIALLNNQIRWIIGDENVHVFYSKVYDEQFLGILGQYDEFEKLLQSSKQLLDD